MFNCDHCQKKYKRSWHQARHSQMKHENSNASTATTSSAGTPPTPEINGNVTHNSNYNYQQLQQVPQMPSQPLVQDINHTAPAQQHHQLQQNASVSPVTTNSWSPMAHPQQQQLNQHHNVGYPSVNDMTEPKNYQTPPMPVQPSADNLNNGEYVNYAVNEQYSNKFEQVQTTPAGAASAPNPTSYDSWVSFLLNRVSIVFLMFHLYV